MIRSEAERQFYLGAAGIRLWYARQPLPGAAPSPEFDFPEEAGAPEAPLAASGPASHPGAGSAKTARAVALVKDRNEGAARIADLQALMESGGGGLEKPAREAPEPKTPVDAEQNTPQTTSVAEVVAPAPAGQVQNVNLMVWAGANVALIAEVSTEASTRLQETLALNILNSLGEREPRVLGQVRWPVFNNLLVPGNTTGDLAEVVRNVLSGLDRQNVVVLGVATNSWNEWLPEALGGDVAVDFQHSLAELAGNPAIKRSLWHQLKTLAGR